MRYTVRSCISSLLFSSVVYAADCLTSFDNSCFPQSSEQQPLDDSEEEARAREKADQEQAAAQQAQEQADAYAELEDLVLQQRAYEQSIIANQLAGGFTLQADELRGLSASEVKEARERYSNERPAALIARSREALARRQAEILGEMRRRNLRR